MADDFYKILGVSKTVSDDELKKVYRKLAKKYHPDVSKEANAEVKFKQVQAAYEVLGKPENRKFYDQYGEHWKQAKEQGLDPNKPPGGGFGGGFNRRGAGGGFHTSDSSDIPEDLLSSLFGQQGYNRRRPVPKKGADLRAHLHLDLVDVYEAKPQKLQLRTGHSLEMKLPLGLEAGQEIRLAGQGEQGSHGGAVGDLFVKIDFKPHALFTVKGHDIYFDLLLSPWEAALGTTVTVPTLGGKVELKIVPGSQSGQKLRLKNRGLPAKERGYQYCVLQIVTPPAETTEAKQFYKKMAEAFSGFNPRENY
jgi:curved DNA-binding protein